jgi:hypothetical protein
VTIEALGVPATLDWPSRWSALAGLRRTSPSTASQLRSIWKTCGVRTITTGLVDAFSTPTFLRLPQRGELDADRFVTRRFPLHEFDEAHGCLPTRPRLAHSKCSCPGARQLGILQPPAGGDRSQATTDALSGTGTNQLGSRLSVDHDPPATGRHTRFSPRVNWLQSDTQGSVLRHRRTGWATLGTALLSHGPRTTL